MIRMGGWSNAPGSSVGGDSQIAGLRRGTLAEVTEYAEACAKAFNGRSIATNARALTRVSGNKR